MVTMKGKVAASITIVALFLSFITFPFAGNIEKNYISTIQEEKQSLHNGGNVYGIQWEKDYGKVWWWSARYEGPQPVGDADNDGKNELLIGGRDPFMRVMKWDEERQTYYEQARIVDPVFGIGYRMFGIPQPFGSATGFSIADIDNDGENEIGVAWGRHFSAFKWDGKRYRNIGRYIVTEKRAWETTLDCIVGDCDNDGKNEVVVTGGYSNPNTPEVLILSWDGSKFVKESEWNAPGRFSVYFPWIADVDGDGKNEIICNTNETLVLKWDKNSNTWNVTVVATYGKKEIYPFGCVSKDSDGDGMPEIHVTFYAPELKIFEWNGYAYEEKWSYYWDGKEGTIEAIDIGDVDNDGKAEVCVGTDKVHILQWDGFEYKEEYMINETYGLLAVTCIGDFDNDGKNEINAGAVGVDEGESYKAWIFKYGWGET